MFKVISAGIAALTLVALLATTTQSVPTEELRKIDMQQLVKFDSTGAMRLERRG